jgi:hypothetical protein
MLNPLYSFSANRRKLLGGREYRHTVSFLSDLCVANIIMEAMSETRGRHASCHRSSPFPCFVVCYESWLGARGSHPAAVRYDENDATRPPRKPNSVYRPPTTSSDSDFLPFPDHSHSTLCSTLDPPICGLQTPHARAVIVSLPSLIPLGRVLYNYHLQQPTSATARVRSLARSHRMSLPWAGSPSRNKHSVSDHPAALTI